MRRLGRPTKLEQTRRERACLQQVAAGSSWFQAASKVGMTAAAVLRLQERLGVGLPDHVQLEGPS